MMVHKRTDVTVSMICATQREDVKVMIVSQSLNPLVEGPFGTSAGQIVKESNAHKYGFLESLGPVGRLHLAEVRKRRQIDGIYLGLPLHAQQSFAENWAQPINRRQYGTSSVKGIQLS